MLMMHGQIDIQHGGLTPVSPQPCTTSSYHPPAYPARDLHPPYSSQSPPTNPHPHPQHLPPSLRLRNHAVRPTWRSVQIRLIPVEHGLCFPGWCAVVGRQVWRLLLDSVLRWGSMKRGCLLVGLILSWWARMFRLLMRMLRPQSPVQGISQTGSTLRTNMLTIASSGSMFGSIPPKSPPSPPPPPSAAISISPSPDAPAAADAAKAPPSPARMGDEAITSDRRCGPGGIETM
jgi:hypothetical protein